jgi:hypothetical protein
VGASAWTWSRCGVTQRTEYATVSTLSGCPLDHVRAGSHGGADRPTPEDRFRWALLRVQGQLVDEGETKCRLDIDCGALPLSQQVRIAVETACIGAPAHWVEGDFLKENVRDMSRQWKSEQGTQGWLGTSLCGARNAPRVPELRNGGGRSCIQVSAGDSCLPDAWRPGGVGKEEER